MGAERDEGEIVSSILRRDDALKKKSIFLNGEEKWVGSKKKI